MTSDAVTTHGRVLHWAARYDLLVWLLTHGRDRAFRERLVDLARLAPGESVLDVGCGTGTLAIAARRRVGATGEVFGIDPSPAMIARAVSKAGRARVDVSFTNGAVEALPFTGGRFDAVLSTLMLHHLPRKVRQQCAREIGRVLKPEGRVLVVDFGQGQNKGSVLARFHRHGHVDTREIAMLLDEAGFRPRASGAVGISSLQFVLATIRA